MTHPFDDQHLSAAGIQAFLDHGLPSGDVRRVEEHLASCARCEARVEGWSAIFEELDGLPRLVPHEGFQARVLSEVRLPRARSWAARAWTALTGWIPSGTHPGSRSLQELADGSLPDAVAARTRSHLEGCRRCSGSYAVWRVLSEELDGLGHLSPGDDFAAEVMASWRLEGQLASLGHLEPSAGFQDAVMAGVRIPDPVAAPAPAPASSPAWERLLAAAGRLVPTSRAAWASLSGLAVTPAVTVGLVLWTVFSHPSLTMGSLASFAWWKVTDLATAAWGATSPFALDRLGVVELWDTLGGLAASPGTLTFVGLVFCIGSLASSWVLYRHLFTPARRDGLYAHARG